MKRWFVSNRHSNLSERLNVLNASRVLIAFTLCLFTLIFQPGGEDFSWGKEFFITLGLTVSNLFIAIGFFVHARFSNKRKPIFRAYAHLSWDAIFSTSLVYLSGIKLLYLFTIVNAAFLLFWHGAFYIGLLSSGLYASLLFALFAERIPLIFERVWKPVLWSNHFVTQSVVVHTVIFLMCAWGFARLANSFEQSEEKLKARAAQLEVKANESEKLAAIGEMSARMAHEIRNPLTSISGAIQILRSDGNQNEEEKHLMDIVLKETDRLNDLLTEFLEFARPHEAYYTDVELSQLVSDVLELFAKDEENKANFNGTIQKGIFIEGDEKKLSQLTWNLVKNAFDAVEKKGNIQIDLSENDSGITLKIKDDGPGIPKDIHQKMFEPFFTTKTKGSGLGLAVVQRITNDHEGSLFIESKENEGTLFQVCFPKKLAKRKEGLHA